jgi:hypothetical protein
MTMAPANKTEEQHHNQKADVDPVEIEHFVFPLFNSPAPWGPLPLPHPSPSQWANLFSVSITFQLRDGYMDGVAFSAVSWNWVFS